MIKINRFVIAYSLLFSSLSFADSVESQCQFNGIDYDKASAFVASLQKVVAANDKEAVALLATYPLKINRISKAGKVVSTTIKNKEAFVSQYNTLFSSKLKSAIIHQKLDDIFCNWQGAMIAHSGIWFKTDVKVGGQFFVINMPSTDVK